MKVRIVRWLDLHSVDAEARQETVDGYMVRSWYVTRDGAGGWDEWRLVRTIGECREWMGY